MIKKTYTFHSPTLGLKIYVLWLMVRVHGLSLGLNIFSSYKYIGLWFDSRNCGVKYVFGYLDIRFNIILIDGFDDCINFD